MTPDELIRRAKAHCAKHGIALSTVSRKILGSGKELALMDEGKRSIRWDTLQSAFERLSALEADADRKDAA